MKTVLKLKNSQVNPRKISAQLCQVRLMSTISANDFNGSVVKFAVRQKSA